VHREYGRFDYVWTRERTKRGWAHLHALASVEVDQSWLSGAWLEVTGGSWVVDVKPIESNRVGDYLAKYCTKEARRRARLSDGTRRRTRVFSKSRGLVFEPFIAGGGSGGVLVPLPWYELRDRVQGAGGALAEKVIGAPWQVLSSETVAAVWPVEAAVEGVS
jgi:hypothetical protein